MSLLQTTKLDIIVDSPHHDGYDFIMYDAGEIEDEVERFYLFLEKAKSYLNFIANKSFEKEYPHAKEKDVRICVIYSTPPNKAMLQVNAIRAHNSDEFRIPVIFQTKAEYMAKR